MNKFAESLAACEDLELFYEVCDAGSRVWLSIKGRRVGRFLPEFAEIFLESIAKNWLDVLANPTHRVDFDWKALLETHNMTEAIPLDDHLTPRELHCYLCGLVAYDLVRQMGNYEKALQEIADKTYDEWKGATNVGA